MNETEFIKSMEVLTLKPGDILVIKTDKVLSVENAKRIKEIVSDFTKEKVMILDGGLDMGVLRHDS